MLLNFSRTILSERVRRAALVTLSIAFVSLASVSCNSGDDDNNSGMNNPGGGGGDDDFGANGTMSLSGSDTGLIGSDFVIGDVAREIDDVFPIGYLFVDAPKMFTANEFAQDDFNPVEDIIGYDGDNTTLLAVLVDEAGSVTGVSLGFRRDGADYGYTCNNDAGGSGQACGDVVFDQDAEEFIFNGVILEPLASSSATDMLTLDGVISLDL